MGQIGLEWTELDQNEPSMTKVDLMDRIGPKWTQQTELDQIGPKWTKQNHIEYNRIELNCTEQDQIEVGALNHIT